MAITYKCNLAGGGSGGSIKDAFRAKVFGDTTGMIVNEVSPFNNRCEINEGRWVRDETNTTVYVYVDFNTLTTQSATDYWFQVILNNFSSSYLPQTTTTSRVGITLNTDESSTVNNSFFVGVTSSAGIFVHKGDLLTQGDHYIVYGAWQY